MTVPLIADYLIGYRKWRVVAPDEPPFRPRLYAAMHHSISNAWIAGGKPTEAECGCGHTHTAPDIGCQCGLYCLNDPNKAMDKTDGPFITGGIIGWGQVINHNDGWRSQYAQPMVFFEHPDPTMAAVLRVVARDYHVLVLVGEAAVRYMETLGTPASDVLKP